MTKVMRAVLKFTENFATLLYYHLNGRCKPYLNICIIPSSIHTFLVDLLASCLDYTN